MSSLILQKEIGTARPGEVYREYLKVKGAAYLSSELLDALKDLGTARPGEVTREYLGLDQGEGGPGTEGLPLHLHNREEVGN